MGHRSLETVIGERMGLLKSGKNVSPIILGPKTWELHVQFW